MSENAKISGFGNIPFGSESISSMHCRLDSMTCTGTWSLTYIVHVLCPLD